MESPPLDQIFSLVQDNKWWALAVLLIGLVIRLLKSDGPIPIEIPPKWRAPLAAFLGIVAGVIDKIATGTAWKNALLGGLLAAAMAAFGHDIFIASARDGRELGESKKAHEKRKASLPPPPPSKVSHSANNS